MTQAYVSDRAEPDLDHKIYDLVRASRIAVLQLYAAVGELECIDGKITRAPDE